MRPALPSSRVLRRALRLSGVGAAAAAGVVAPGAAASALSRSWSPFVLVVGLLLIGQVANADGLFDRMAAATTGLRGGARALLVALLGNVGGVAAVLNLDTSVAFLKPVLALSARRRGLEETPFVLGSLVMANAASLLLPGSNLTNPVGARPRTRARRRVRGADAARVGGGGGHDGGGAAPPLPPRSGLARPPRLRQTGLRWIAGRHLHRGRRRSCRRPALAGARSRRGDSGRGPPLWRTR